MRHSLALIVLLAACGSKADPGGAEGSAKAKPTDQARKIAGVWPDKFTCESVLPIAKVSELLGGTAAEAPNPMSVPAGVAKPCSYEVVFAQPADLAPDALGRPPEYWTFDFDCRDNMKQTADALFAQYSQTNSDRIAQFNAATDAGVLPGKPDANVAVVAPGAAHEVEVGARALDHNDQSILFLDDDAPCYARVNGPDAERRLALAKAVSAGLTLANAPMEPRSVP